LIKNGIKEEAIPLAIVSETASPWKFLAALTA